MPDKLLLVDDSQIARKSIRDALSEIFPAVIEAEDGITAIKAFIEEKPGFIITDIEMPSVDGYRFISTIRGMNDGKDVPIIMLSATRNTLKNKLRGFNLGASDFVIKPFEPEELVARVKSLLKMRGLVEELKEKNALLNKLAVTDELTGLFNRRHFFESVKEQLALSSRNKIGSGCMIMDIDHFKKINDTWGHLAGDEILRKLGSLLNSCKREGEILARFGGEEFILYLFNTDTEKALLAAQRFRNLIKSYDFASANLPVRNITVSIGLSIYANGTATRLDDMIKSADGALYQAKDSGRDRVALYECPPPVTPPPDATVDEKRKA